MYTDLLIKIKNAQNADKEYFKTVYSKMDLAVAEILVANHYIESVEKKGRMPARVLEIKLNKSGGRKINEVKFISKPSRRIYAGFKDLKSVRQGYGLGVISTSRGLMTTKDAKKLKIGGQLLFEIW